MDNSLIWDSLGRGYIRAIQGLFVKVESSKFWTILLPSGKVMLRNWIGMYLAPMSVGADPNAYPIVAVSYSEDESLQFEVFYRDNKVAFRAYNGLFLTRVYRSFHTIEAAKIVADDSCCFRPMIGDLHVPTFKIIKVKISDLAVMQYYLCVLKKETFINRSDEPKHHTFSMTWETTVTDKIVWKRLWGRGFDVSCQFTITGTTTTLKYTKDNEKVVSVIRRIHEQRTKEVVVPPKRKSTARLLVNKNDNAAFPFWATIRKVKSNGDVVALKEQGAWSGLLYCSVQLEVVTERLPDPCTTM